MRGALLNQINAYQPFMHDLRASKLSLVRMCQIDYFNGTYTLKIDDDPYVTAGDISEKPTRRGRSKNNPPPPSCHSRVNHQTVGTSEQTVKQQ